MSTPSHSTPSRAPRRAGFTLVELLIVVAIIGILLGLLSGAIKYTVKVAKEKKIAAECSSLRVALVTYWHDYNHWPHVEGQEQQTDNSKGQRLRIYTGENWKVFNRLSAMNTAMDANPMGKAYLDESALTTTTGASGQGARVGLAKKRGGGFNSTDKSALVDGDGRPYKVTFDLVQNTASVSRQ